MKVLVLSTMAPFVWGGAEELATHLVRNLVTNGVEAEAFRIPFAWDPAERLIEEMLISRSLRLWNIDRVIALKFPIYLVPWPDKVVWLVHQYRQAYDLLDAGQSNIRVGDGGRRILTAIRAADKLAFEEAKALYTISQTVSDRLAKYNQISSTVLRYPLNDPELFAAADDGGYVLATGRINSAKRQRLLVEAMRHAPGARLVIAGPPDAPEDGEDLRRMAAAADVESRVCLNLRFLPRRELAALVNDARAVAYLPLDEDSVGYCTLEAFQAGKPVITATDSGGVLDLVRDGETGLVVEPEPQALGQAICQLSDSSGLASRLGAAAKATLEAMELTWPKTIEKLLS